MFLITLRCNHLPTKTLKYKIILFLKSINYCKKRGGRNCTQPTCGLAYFNKTHMWFKTYHLPHLRCPPLDTRYSPLPFPLTNLFYYISQKLESKQNPKKKNKLSPSLYLRILKNAQTHYPFSLYFDCLTEFKFARSLFIAIVLQVLMWLCVLLFCLDLFTVMNWNSWVL